MRKMCLSLCYRASFECDGHAEGKVDNCHRRNDLQLLKAALALPALDSEVEVPPPSEVTDEDFNAWEGINDDVEVADEHRR